MLSHTIAKELQNAGFPQKIEWGSFCYNEADNNRLVICTRAGAIAKDREVSPDAPSLVFVPQLADILLDLPGYYVLEKEAKQYICYVSDKVFESPVGLDAIDTFLLRREHASTPDEAAALLWLMKNYEG